MSDNQAHPIIFDSKNAQEYFPKPGDSHLFSSVCLLVMQSSQHAIPKVLILKVTRDRSRFWEWFFKVRPSRTMKYHDSTIGARRDAVKRRDVNTVMNKATGPVSSEFQAVISNR